MWHACWWVGSLLCLPLESLITVIFVVFAKAVLKNGDFVDEIQSRNSSSIDLDQIYYYNRNRTPWAFVGSDGVNSNLPHHLRANVAPNILVQHGCSINYSWCFTYSTSKLTYFEKYLLKQQIGSHSCRDLYNKKTRIIAGKTWSIISYVLFFVYPVFLYILFFVYPVFVYLVFVYSYYILFMSNLCQSRKPIMMKCGTNRICGDKILLRLTEQ